MNPVLVDVSRGNSVESRHRGMLVIVDNNGQELLSIGDSSTEIYPRSAIKPLQAIPLLESGAANKYALKAEHIALACASHNGEKRHTETVTTWLGMLGLSPDDLECGPQTPRCEPELRELYLQQGQPQRVHNNCSGKHSGFLSYCTHLGHATDGYIDADHPVQMAWANTLSELSDTDLSKTSRGIDGCGIPVIGIPLTALARAMAQFAKPSKQTNTRQKAIAAIREAMAQDPFMVAGSKRFCTDIMQITGTKALVKTGAEGVFCAAFPELGLGVALKIDDGGTRAAEVTMAATLRALKVLDKNNQQAAQNYAEPILKNFAGREVGRVLPSKSLLENLNQL